MLYIIVCKIMPKTPVLKPKVQRVHQASILNLEGQPGVLFLFITHSQVNHVIPNLRIMQSCRWPPVCIDKINKPKSLQNKQGVKSHHQGNGGVVKTLHQG